MPPNKCPLGQPERGIAAALQCHRVPCNVTLYEEDDGSVVTAVDPVETLGVLKEDPVAHEVGHTHTNFPPSFDFNHGVLMFISNSIN